MTAMLLFPLGAECGAPFRSDDPNGVAFGHVELLFFYRSALAATGVPEPSRGSNSTTGSSIAPSSMSRRRTHSASPRGSSTAHGYGDALLASTAG